MENEEQMQENVPAETNTSTDLQNPPNGTVEDLESYTDNAEMVENMYEVDFIKNDICSQEMQYNTVYEFQACQAWQTSEAVVAFGNIIIGVLLGFLVVKGLFESWR